MSEDAKAAKRTNTPKLVRPSEVKRNTSNKRLKRSLQSKEDENVSSGTKEIDSRFSVDEESLLRCVGNDEPVSSNIIADDDDDDSLPPPNRAPPKPTESVSKRTPPERPPRDDEPPQRSPTSPVTASTKKSRSSSVTPEKSRPPATSGTTGVLQRNTSVPILSVDGVVPTQAGGSRVTVMFSKGTVPSAATRFWRKQKGFDPTTANIPAIVAESCDFIEERALETEGLFRVSSDNLLTRRLTSKYKKGKTGLIKDQKDHHLVAGSLKLFLRELPEPLFTYELYGAFLAAVRVEEEMRVECVRQTLTVLPLGCLAILSRLINMLILVSENEEANKMSKDNLARVFAPTLMRARKPDMTAFMVEIPLCQRVVDVILEHGRTWFPRNEPPQLKERPVTSSHRMSSAGSDTTLPVQVDSRSNSLTVAQQTQSVQWKVSPSNSKRHTTKFADGPLGARKRVGISEEAPLILPANKFLTVLKTATERLSTRQTRLKAKSVAVARDKEVFDDDENVVDHLEWLLEQEQVRVKKELSALTTESETKVAAFVREEREKTQEDIIRLLVASERRVSDFVMLNERRTNEKISSVLNDSATRWSKQSKVMRQMYKETLARVKKDARGEFASSSDDEEDDEEDSLVSVGSGDDD